MCVPYSHSGISLLVLSFIKKGKSLKSMTQLGSKQSYQIIMESKISKTTNTHNKDVTEIGKLREQTIHK